MIIEKIQKNKLYLSNGEILDISPNIRYNYHLKVNDDISKLYDKICYDAAFEKGLFLLSLRDRTSKELKMKLSEKYKNIKMIEKSIVRLEELGYVNDVNYVSFYIKNKKYGKKRIVFELIQKGINKNIIEEVYSELESKNELENEKLEKIILKNIKKEDKKLIPYLLRQGFELEKILSKLKELREKI